VIRKGGSYADAKTVPCFLGAILSPVLFLWSLTSCASAPPVDGTPITANAAPTTQAAKATQSVAEEIRALTEMGTPPSLIRSLDLIRARDLSQTEYGRAMSAVATTLLVRLYPDIQTETARPDPPPSSPYTRILRDAERAVYLPPSTSSDDYLEYVLPFLALLDETRPERLAAATPDLTRASTLGRTSVLDSYFTGIVAERRSDFAAAIESYNKAIAVSSDCYPAIVGAARSLIKLSRAKEAVALLSDLIVRYPDNMLVKRELAKAYYQSGDFDRAGPAVAEVLQREPKNSAFILMQAHIFVAQGSYVQAQPLLDAYAAVDSSDRLYLYLRARVQADGYQNRDAALTYLRSLLRSFPDDSDALTYAARLLIEGGRVSDLDEARRYLDRLKANGVQSLEVLELELKDALSRKAWAEAAPIAGKLGELRGNASDYRAAFDAYRGSGDTVAALNAATTLMEKDQRNDEYAALYARALIEADKKGDALTFLEGRISTASSGKNKSVLYYLRSLLKTDEESRLGDLRSSLFEDPRNLEALVAMFEIYRAKKDDRRSVYYLKQALALSPDDPTLKAYRTELGPLMNN